jgi:hypothetical protein
MLRGEAAMFSKTSRLLFAFVAAVALLVFPACAEKRARVRPIEGGPVSAAPGSLDATRKQLEGTWKLVSAEIVSADGKRRTVKASAVMTYDGFGNFSIKGAFEDPNVPSDQTAALNFTGRAVIDVQKHELHLLDVQQPEGDFAKLPPEVSAARSRAYAFSGDELTMTVKNAKGQVAGVNTWRKAQ